MILFNNVADIPGLVNSKGEFDIWFWSQTERHSMFLRAVHEWSDKDEVGKYTIVKDGNTFNFLNIQSDFVLGRRPNDMLCYKWDQETIETIELMQT